MYGRVPVQIQAQVQDQIQVEIKWERPTLAGAGAGRCSGAVNMARWYRCTYIMCRYWYFSTVQYNTETGAGKHG